MLHTYGVLTISYNSLYLFKLQFSLRLIEIWSVSPYCFIKRLIIKMIHLPSICYWQRSVFSKLYKTHKPDAQIKFEVYNNAIIIICSFEGGNCSKVYPRGRDHLPKYTYTLIHLHFNTFDPPSILKTFKNCKRAI